MYAQRATFTSSLLVQFDQTITTDGAITVLDPAKLGFDGTNSLRGFGVFSDIGSAFQTGMDHSLIPGHSSVAMTPVVVCIENTPCVPTLIQYIGRGTIGKVQFARVAFLSPEEGKAVVLRLVTLIDTLVIGCDGFSLEDITFVALSCPKIIMKSVSIPPHHPHAPQGLTHVEFDFQSPMTGTPK
jgi:hypothetical protein